MRGSTPDTRTAVNARGDTAVTTGGSYANAAALLDMDPDRTTTTVGTSTRRGGATHATLPWSLDSHRTAHGSPDTVTSGAVDSCEPVISNTKLPTAGDATGPDDDAFAVTRVMTGAANDTDTAAELRPACTDMPSDNDTS
jgi:hypothetical protein